MKIYIAGGVDMREHEAPSYHVRAYNSGTFGIEVPFYAEDKAQSVIVELSPQDALLLAARLVTEIATRGL